MANDLVIANLHSAWAALQKASTIPETKKIADLADAAYRFAKRQGMSKSIIDEAYKIRIYAVDKLEEMYQAGPKDKGGRPSKSGMNVSRFPTLPELGIDKNTAILMRTIGPLPAAMVKAVAEQKLTVQQVKRQLKERKREAKREQNRELTKKAPVVVDKIVGQRYQTIVLDPPWDWGDEGDFDQHGRARPTYDTMTIDEIADPEKVPVIEFADKNAHLYLWITNRSLPKGFALLAKWGFRYITMLTWVKPSYGMGNYYRGSTEQVLFGVKGSLPLLRNDLGTHFMAERAGNHSTKPPEFYAMVESASPGRWIEFFARHLRPGWAAWGAEVNEPEQTTV